MCTSKELGCRWKFTKANLGYNLGEGSSLSKRFDGSYRSMVKESLQNSIDARLDKSKPVKVCYNIKNAQVSEYPELFNIKDHVEKCIEAFKSTDDNKEIYVKMLDYLEGLKEDSTFNYLVVSDYNTSGMDFHKNGVIETGKFASFVRSEGENDKEDGSSAGSFGVGKGAYFGLSNIRTLLVSTRFKDNTTNFEGVTQLRSHIMDNAIYFKVAYYDNSNEGEIGVPVSNEDNIPHDFRREAVGTDISIIGIDNSKREFEKKAYKEITKAVLLDFWFAIYKEILIVEIGDNVKINKANLNDYLLENFQQEGDENLHRNLAIYNPRPYYFAVTNDLPNHVYKFKENLPIVGPCEFYLYKNKGKGKVLHMRAAHMLVHIEKKYAYSNICGVFVCTNDDGNNIEGNKILKRLENETHDKWEPKAKDEVGRSALEEITKWIDGCLSKALGTIDKDDVDVTSLSDYLPSFDEEDEESVEYYISNSSSASHSIKQPKKKNTRKTRITQITTTGAITNIDGELLGGKDGTLDGITQSKEQKQGDQGHKEDSQQKKDHGQHSQAKNHKAGQAIEDDFGDVGRYTKQIEVPCYSSMQEIEGKMHFLINIKPNRDIEHAAIKISIKGELSSEQLNIQNTNFGKKSGSSIIDFPLIGNKMNRLDVVFENSNEELALIITPYEYK